jgi:hypothetical protein
MGKETYYIGNRNLLSCIRSLVPIYWVSVDTDSCLSAATPTGQDGRRFSAAVVAQTLKKPVVTGVANLLPQLPPTNMARGGLHQTACALDSMVSLGWGEWPGEGGAAAGE